MPIYWLLWSKMQSSAGPMGLGDQLAHTVGLHKRKAAILCMHVKHSVRTPFHTMGDHPWKTVACVLLINQELVRTFKPN